MPSALQKLEHNRAAVIQELTRILNHLGLEVFPSAFDDFRVEAGGYSLRPVSTVEEFLNLLPSGFLLTERSQINRMLLVSSKGKTNGSQGSYGFLIYNRHEEFCGFLVTDLFLDNQVWVFESLVRQYSGAGELRALLQGPLATYVERLAMLKELARPVNTLSP
jgi:hypothetical protein